MNGFALLYIPASGLHFDGVSFLDGDGNRLKWQQKIICYRSHARARKAKQKIIDKHPVLYGGGQIVILGFEVEEKD